MAIRKRVGMNVREMRTQRKVTAEELARNMKGLGFSWSVSRVSDLERGDKSVSIPELIALAFSLSTANSPVKLSELFDGSEPILLSEKMSITTEHMMQIFEGEPLSLGIKDWPLRYQQFMDTIEKSGPLVTASAKELDRFNAEGVDANAVEGAYASIGLAELKAAKALGITMAELIGACLALWGRTLTVERDSRAEGLRGQAKGHVTRQLLDELREHIGKFNGND